MIYNITIWMDNTAERYPEKTAIVDGERTMTFRKLRYKALCLAERIIERGFFREPIAILMSKSVDMIIAFLATAYSGNFYSVIDVDMPVMRREKVIETLEPKLIITTEQFEIDNSPCDTYKYDCEKLELINEDKVIMQRDKTCDADLLYVLFTSGSTGVPKGVTITHQSVIDYIDWVTETFKIDSNDSFGNQAPFYFDNSVLDIYSMIRTGATMYIIPKQLFSQPVPLLNYLKENNITTIFWVPSALIVVANLHALKKVDLRNTLKRVLFAGEVMPNKQLNMWRDSIPNIVYANLYGPTEITVDCTCYIVDRKFSDDEPLPIGKAIKNTDIIVLNERNTLVKTGEIGELCVRGTSISKGYYNNIEKTRDVFVQNPLNNCYIEYIYRTGDLVKYNEYGELFYVARKDFQIKHRGHRIELGEIEMVVFGIDGVQQCCCVYDYSKKRIILFIQGDTAKKQILDVIKMQLPKYMIPEKIVIVEAIPINANGKIDRKKLQERVDGGVLG